MDKLNVYHEAILFFLARDDFFTANLVFGAPYRLEEFLKADPEVIVKRFLEYKERINKASEYVER